MMLLAVMSVVIFGFAALVIDMGRIYVERNALQNGADAAALAIASDCAEGHCGGSYDEFAVADMYADANSGDDTATVLDVQINPSLREVTVTVGTEEPGGANAMDMLFASMVGAEDVTVSASATVQWGAPGSLISFPLTMSKCEWTEYGELGFADTSPQGYLHRAAAVREGELPPTAGYQYRAQSVTIYFHGATTCHDSSSGQDLPGGFGWLDADGNECAVKLHKGGNAAVDPGSSPARGCDASDVAGMLGTVQILPVFDGYTGQGNNGEYQVSGFGSLYVTGYNFGGQFKEDSLIDGQLPCNGNQRCIQGYLLGDWAVADEGGAPLSAEDLGVVTTRFSS